MLIALPFGPSGGNLLIEALLLFYRFLQKQHSLQS